MVQFTKNNIQTRLSLGARLREHRLRCNLSLDDISEHSAIARRNLEYLEHDQFEKIPEDLYRELFLKTYATYLGLSWDDIKKQYEEEYHVYHQDGSSQNTTRLKRKDFFLSSKIVANSLRGALLIGCFGYLLFLGIQAIQPPTLYIETPYDNLTSRDDRIVVIGKTFPSAEVRINGERVIKSHDGSFRQEIGLSEGANMILISASKKYSREERIVRNVVYEKENIVSAFEEIYIMN